MTSYLCAAGAGLFTAGYILALVILIHRARDREWSEGEAGEN